MKQSAHNRPSLGIVMAARNAAGTIELALRSVIDEVFGSTKRADLGFVSIDILVIDGSSTDDTSKIAERFPGVRVSAQVEQGLANARNQGIAEVNGELIAFIDADDQWARGSLELRLRTLMADRELLGVVGHMVTEAIEGQRVDARHRERIGMPIPAFTPGALLVHRHAFDQVGGFDESLTIASDSEWFVRARSAGHKIELIDAIVLKKGVRSDSLSTDVLRYRRELLEVSRRFLEARGQQK